MLPVIRYLAMNTFCRGMTYYQKSYSLPLKGLRPLIKDEVLITVSCPIFPSILIAKYLFTGSLKNRSIDNAKEIYFNEKFPIL
jgi:hypothetical protein